MKIGALLPVAAATVFMGNLAYGASVGPTGYTNAFGSRPPSADWATVERAGGAADNYDMNADVNGNILAGGVTAQVGSTTGNPPGAGGIAVWSSTGLYLQTRPTQVRYIALMGKFVNNTGSNATQVRVSYAFTIAEGGVLEESGMGMRVYYSLTGLANSWANLPTLNSTSSTEGRVNLSANIALEWANGTSLFLLWVDDNTSVGSGSADPANQIDNFSLQVTEADPPPLVCTLNVPGNGAVLPTGPINARAVVSFGRGPYAVQYFTNSGVGIIEFAPAGSSEEAPFELRLGTFTPGTYNVYAVAFDSAAGSATSTTNTFVVVDPLQVTLQGPANGATFDHLTPVIAAAATAGGTPPYSVQFYLDNVPSGGLITAPPYEREFGALFVGDHTIRARVMDARGWVSNSATHTLHVTGPLGVTFVPTNGAAFAQGQPVILRAEPGGGTGPYTVTFYTNGQAAGAISSGPYILNIGILPPGYHASYVRVVDSATPVPAEVSSTTNVFQVVFNPLFVTLTEPDEGDLVLEGTPFTLTASAFVGAPVTIGHVEFFYEDSLVGRDAISPYAVALTNHIDGTRRIYAVATDSLGRTSYSTTNRLVVVDNAPPSNDNFNNPIPLSGPAVTVTAHNLTATRESGEPNHAVGNSGGGSVWWTWTPSTTGPATIDTFGSSYDTLLGVYTGNAVNQLTVIAQNDDSSGLQSRVQFNATAGTVYRIAVDGFGGSRGLIVLNIRGAGAIELVSPTNGMMVTANDSITITARILPDFPNLPPSRVDFYRGNILFASLANEPFTAIASNVPAGSNSFYVVAWDSQGTRIQSGTATVFVQAIGVMILSPLANTTFATTNPITINAWTYLPEGAITNVEFLVNGVRIGQDGTFPFSAIWSNVVGGSHRLIAVGRSDRGAVYQSAPANIGVVEMFVPPGAVWRYRDDGSDQGTNWIRRDFDDRSWASGPSPLGFGDSGGRLPATTNASGHATIYYRYAFVVTNVGGWSFLDTRLERDDGAIVYFNGREITRQNMPAGPVTYTQYASQVAGDDGQSSFGIFVSTADLIEGTNVLAVEIHQDAPGGTDLWFQMRLGGFPIIIQNLAPVVSVTNPTNNQYFLAPSSITLQAEASDPETEIALVEFFADGVKVGEATNAPYRTVWGSPSVGAHIISARATDDEGGAALSPLIPIVVYDAVGTPLARITSPLDGAIMQGPTNLLVAAVAHAPPGVTNVQFLANGMEFGNDGTAPYSADWNAPFGTNLLTAIAFDANGAKGTSAVITVTITIPPTNVIPPVIVMHLPTDGTTMTNLTSITVRFSENVQNVDAADLLINGVPAASVDANHSRSNYTFTFPQPSYGRLTIMFAPGHGITDYGWPSVLPFDEQGEGGIWGYTLVDALPPTIVARTPAPGSTVTNLSQITVTFSEEVSGVDAADLRLNGAPALEVSGSGSNYVFRVAQPPPGTIGVVWATDHNIFDLAAAPNPFDRAAPGAAWTFILDTRTVLVQSNSLWRFVRGTTEASVPMDAWRQLGFNDSGWLNAAAPFFYGDPYDSPQYPGTLLSDMANNYSTVYLRTEFTVLNRALITNIWLNVQSDDGFIAWINGVEVRRYNAPAGAASYNAVATGIGPEPQNRGAAYIVTALTNAVAALVDGRNVLAVHGLNQQTSSDFGFNAQLYTYPIDVATVGPSLLLPMPLQGDVLYLTNITVTFTEPVSGVNAADLLVNGVPATALSSAMSSVYTFTFPQPPFGPVIVTWDTNHAIMDLDAPPRLFNGDAATSILAYHIINPSSPRILTQAPLGGSTLTGLTAIVVTFTEPVSGVDAADLLVSGAPATSVSNNNGTNYTFSFNQPPFGFVAIQWVASHDIVDVEGGNIFDPTRSGGQWNYTVIDPAPSVTITSPTNGTSRLEPAMVTLAAVASDYDGTVVRVDYYDGVNLLGGSTSAPYNLIWSNLTVGTYVLRAVATDNMGFRGTSAPVVLNVVTSLPAILVRGPYLQMGTSTGGIVRWRTDVPTDGVVHYGLDPVSLTNMAVELAVTNEHIVQISELQPNTRYYYSIGSAAQRLAGTNGVGSDFWFQTSPPPGAAGPTRIWVLGDAGTAGIGSPDRQASTRDAFYNYADGNGPADIWLMLGDNAYNVGSDSEYQRAVFDMYPDTLRNKFLWPTLGNHETSQSTTATDFPYLHIFSLPRNAEAGGAPSGTEKYYSFNHANIHFICLDSMTSGRTSTSPMAEWLRADLASATADWIIVFFHHPPFTKGSHDSDLEGDLIAIRQNLVPIMEANGVDLVLSGHSHCWERSYLLDGHYDFSGTITESMKLDGGDGREDGTGPYRKNEDGRGTVYTVAGSSGQVGGGSLDHPAHFRSINELGSMIIDVDGNRLHGRFLHANGEIQDYFTLMKPDQRPAAPINLVALPPNPTEVSLQWTDVATNELGYVLERSTDGIDFLHHMALPANASTFLDAALIENATYHYRVRATNAAGASDDSNVAGITTLAPTSVPQTPANLIASANNGLEFYRSRILLRWDDASPNEAAFQIERSVAGGGAFVPIGTVAANTTTYQDRGLHSATVYAYRVRAINALGQSPPEVATAQTHPQSQTVHAGDTVAFHAGVEGAPAALYQWHFEEDILLNETNETLRIVNADFGHQGAYTVRIDYNGAQISQPAMLIVLSAPRITFQPRDLVVSAGMEAAFAVTVEGTPPFTYRWRRDGVPLPITTSTLNFASAMFGDQAGYDVVINNDYGSITSRVATLGVFTVPSLVQVPDLFAEVLKPLLLTNLAVDPNVPPLDLRYALAPGAPTNALIHPRTGFFRWTPNRTQAPSSNIITVGVYDHANTVLSNSMSFNVRVNDYVELAAGSLVVLTNSNGVVPVSVFASAEVTNLQATLQFNGQLFTSISLEELAPQTATATFQRLDANTAALTFTGNILGLNQLARLRFATGSESNSAAVPLRWRSLAALPAQPGLTPTLVATDGQVIVVGNRPLLEAHFNAQGQRELTLFGRPGTYALQYSTNLADPLGWRQRGNVAITTNLIRLVPTANNPPTNLPGFFRLRQ